MSSATRRELIWRIVGLVVLGAASVWAVTRHSWVIAGITAFLAIVMLALLVMALVLWRRGLLK